jgi:hypothetical protein
MGVALRHGNLQPNSNHLIGRQLRIAGTPFWPTLNFGTAKSISPLIFFCSWTIQLIFKSQ